MFQPGDKIGDFRIEGLISESSSVYTLFRARQISLDRPVALKILSPNLAKNPAFTKRFQTEGKALGKIQNHSNIPNIFSTGEVEGYLYTAMELLEGSNLKDLIHKKKKIGWEQSFKILLGISKGVKALHGAGIILRDLKPETIFVPNEATVKITDFGLAKIESGDSTRQGESLGIIYYMSPEQLMGEEIDFKSDFFSMGVILWEMLTGNLPFDLDPTTYLAMIHMREPLPVGSLEELNLPETVRDLVSSLMAYNRDDRPADIDEIIEYLTQCLDPKTSGATDNKTKKGSTSGDDGLAMKPLGEVEPEVKEGSESFTTYIIVALVIFGIGVAWAYFQPPPEDPYKGLVGLAREKRQLQDQFARLAIGGKTLVPTFELELAGLPEGPIYRNRGWIFTKIAGDINLFPTEKSDKPEKVNVGAGRPLPHHQPTSPNIFFLRPNHQLVEFEVSSRTEKGQWTLPEHIADSPLVFQDKIFFVVPTTYELAAHELVGGREVMKTVVHTAFLPPLGIQEERLIFRGGDKLFFQVAPDSGKIEYNLEFTELNTAALPLFNEKHYLVYTRSNHFLRYSKKDPEGKSPQGRFPASQEGFKDPMVGGVIGTFRKQLCFTTPSGFLFALDTDLTKSELNVLPTVSKIQGDSFTAGGDYLAVAFENKLLFLFD